MEGRGCPSHPRGGYSDLQPGQAQTPPGPQAGSERAKVVPGRPFAYGCLLDPGTGVCSANSPGETGLSKSDF